MVGQVWRRVVQPFLVRLWFSPPGQQRSSLSIMQAGNRQMTTRVQWESGWWRWEACRASEWVGWVVAAPWVTLGITGAVCRCTGQAVGVQVQVQAGSFQSTWPCSSSNSVSGGWRKVRSRLQGHRSTVSGPVVGVGSTASFHTQAAYTGLPGGTAGEPLPSAMCPMAFTKKT